MSILGIWDGHDAGAAVVDGGRILFAINEERLSRRKLDIGFPERSIRACAEHLGIDPGGFDQVALSTTDPAKTLTRWVPRLREEYYLLRRKKKDPGRFNRWKKRVKYRLTELHPNALSRSLSRKRVSADLARLGVKDVDLRILDHHGSHAAAAVFCSGFDACTAITLDGIGDGLSGSVYRWREGRLERLADLDGRSSLGIFFEHVTNLMNMRELEDEGKVMALANYAYPIPDSENPLLDFIRVEGLQLRAKYPSLRLYDELARVLWRYPSEQFAYMAQRVLEVRILELVREAIRRTGLPRVALAGGVASNVKVNMLIQDLPEVDELFVFPHMGDGGLAAGAALLLDHELHGSGGTRLRDAFLGPEFPPEEMRRAAESAGCVIRPVSDPAREAAERICDGEIVMWFQGRMEFGPRALGGRSILARADSPSVKDELNLKLKKRVWYQPFCPSMLHDDALEVLENYDGVPNAFMTVAYRVRPEYRDRMRAVINVDGSCRPQILRDERTPYRRLIEKVKERTGFGAVLNTSYNIHGDPVVCSPADAVETFLRTDVRALVMGDHLVTRTAAEEPRCPLRGTVAEPIPG